MSTNPTLNQVRSYTNFGLVLQGNTYDPILTKGWLGSAPSVSIQGSTVYLDYSQSFNTSDRIFLNRTFSSFTAGTTFYVQPSEYYDALTDTRTTLGGTCNFSSTLNNGKIVIAVVASGLTFSGTYNYYDRENFVDIPQYTFLSAGGTISNHMINTFPKGAFATLQEMGFLGSALGFTEYIDISGGTGSNYGRIQVTGVAQLKDNQEVLYLASGITTQNLISTANEVKMYIRGSSTVTEIQEPENITGIYRIHDGNNRMVDCYENQNYYQTFLRKQALGSTYAGYWVQCATCPDGIYGETVAADGIPTNLVFDNNLFLYVARINQSTANGLVPTLTYGVFTQRALSGSPQSATRLTFVINTGLKIDLSHASLQGWNFAVYIDSAYTVPLSNNINISGQPGYDQSYVLITSATDLPRTLYCRLTGPQTLNMTFNL